MKCPICGSTALNTTNSRSTRSNTQTWRRKKCQKCHSTITTYEKPDMSWLNIQDASRAHQEPYKRFLLNKSVLNAFANQSGVEADIDSLVDSIEVRLISNKKTSISREELVMLVLKTLKPVSINAYMSYFASHTHPHNQRELNKLLKIT